MSDASYKMIGIVIMIISVFFLMTGLLITDAYIGSVLKAVMSYGGLLCFIVGFLMMRILGDR